MRVYCTNCGATVDGRTFCSACGKRVSAPPPPPRQSPPPPPPPPAKPADLKGKLIANATTANPPWNPTVGYSFGAAIGVLLVFLGMTMQRHWRDGTTFAAFGIFVCLTALLGRLVARIPRAIRVYERGLEIDIPRSIRGTAWLPWTALLKYEWEGDVLRYTWTPNSLQVLTNGRDRRRAWRPPFPKAARIPAQQVSEVSALLHRHAPPPRR